MEERRAIGRVGYSANAVIVVCDTQEKYFVHTENVSPLGMGIRVPEEVPDILGKDIILVADTLIGCNKAGKAGRRKQHHRNFSAEVL